jgi:hypothetical protein
MANPSGKSCKSPSSPARSGQRRRNAAARGRQQQRGPRVLWIGVAIVAVIAIALGIALAAGSGSKSSAARTPAPAALVAKVTSVPQRVIEQVGAGDGSAEPPKAIDAPALTEGGKPQVLYVGAEYCPYCAAERWAVVNALSRFGTFSDLKITQSSSVDVFPSTDTFSFYGASYTSKYLTFEAVETATSELVKGGGYGRLETPTADQQQLVDKYDSGGGIPFVDLGGRYMINGASYDPTVLQGKSYDEIATAMHDPNGAIAQGVVGAANGITAALCKITNDQPAAVCSVPAVQTLEKALG